MLAFQGLIYQTRNLTPLTMNFETWKTLITSQDSADRVDAADQTPDASPNEFIPFLLECLNDSHPLVRTCAADTLGDFSDDHVREGLRNMVVVEEDELAKAYAIASLGEVGTMNDLKLLIRIFESNPSSTIRLRTAKGMFLCMYQLCVEENFLTFAA